MAKSSFKTKRLNDIGGGINTLYADTDIDENQGVIMDNFGVQGNKLVAMKGFSRVYQFGNTNARTQGIKAFEKYIVAIQNSKIYVYDTTTGISYNLAISGITNADDFNITIGRTFDIYIIVTSTTGTYSPKSFKYVEATHVITNDSSNFDFTGIADTKFTCSIFNNNSLLFGGAPSNPSGLYYSKPFDILVATPTWYKFNVYPAGMQLVGDSSPIVGFCDGKDSQFIGKRNAIHKITGVIDNPDTSSFRFTESKETSTGPTNQESFINVLQDIFYFDGDSVRRLSYEANTLALKDTAISANIHPTLLSFPQDQSKSSSWVSYPYYKLALRSQTSEGNDSVITYNLINKSWGTQSGYSVSHSTSTRYEKSRAYFGTEFDGIVYLDDSGLGIGDGVMNRVYKSRGMNFGDNVDYKRVGEFEIAGAIQPGHYYYLDILEGDNLIETREIFYPSGFGETTGSTTFGVATAGGQGENAFPLNDFRIRVELYNDGRTFYWRLRGLNSGYIEVQAINWMYKYVLAYDIH